MGGSGWSVQAGYAEKYSILVRIALSFINAHFYSSQK